MVSYLKWLISWFKWICWDRFCEHEKSDWFHVDMGMRKVKICLKCHKILDSV